MLNIDIKTVDTLLKKQDGNHSEIYHLIKSRLNNYTDMEIPFAGEFLFFEDHYLRIIKHIIENKNTSKNIIDIGCQYGFQSELFDGIDYIGIDNYPYKFFNKEKEGVSYVVGEYPNIDVNTKNSIVISNMSLGYFNNYLGNNEDEIDDLLVDKLFEHESLYISTSQSLLNKLLKKYSQFEILENDHVLDKEYSLYYFKKCA